MTPRGKWSGMMTIVRLNRAFYAAAVIVLIAVACLAFTVSGLWWKLALAASGAGAAYFLFGSLFVAHWIYDRSDLYRWGWIERALRGASRRDFIFCHSGFDDSSRALRGKLGNIGWMVLDHFNERQMTEPSIRRARKLFPPTAETLPAPHNAWPATTASADVVFGLLAIHEFRTSNERFEWFLEAKRCLRKGGRIVIAEHMRDLANFLAFGPGFLHFHSPRSWRASWQRAGFQCIDEFRITPWIRVFILEIS